MGFNVFEFIGKVSAPYFYAATNKSFIPQHNYDKFLVILSFIRLTIFLYLFALTPTHDAITIALTSFLALSHGCLSSSCFLHSIQLISNHKQYTTSASAILNFMLSIGLFVGSAFTFFYMNIVS